MKHFNTNQRTPIGGKLIMFFQSSFLKIGLLASTVVVLTACGGGGTGIGTGTGSTVSGVAATGMAIADGQVTLKCAVGSAGPTTTQADGSFSIDLSKVTLPCLARMDYVDSAGAKKKLHSVVQGAGNVNITPLTDMVVANLSANGIAASAYDKLDASEAQGYTSDRIKTAIQTAKKTLSSIGVDVTHLPDDVIGSKLIAATTSRKGDSHDHVLDDLQSKLHEQGKTLEDLETEMSAGHEKRGFSTSTGSPGNAAAGKAMYEANCLSCHGPRMPDAVNSSKIINAIRENEGGMGSLAGVINVTAADDIATYMANGSTGGTVPALTTQTIVFASPGNQTIGSAPPALLATSNSGLAVSITSNTPAVCTVSGSTLVLLASGTCSLSANQSGNATYNAAVTVTNSFTVAPSSGVIPTAQTISFASPGPQIVGVTTSLNATASSGLPVDLASTTPSVCTVTGNVLNSLTVGNCIVTANQSGNTNFAAAPMVTLTLSVTSPTPVTSAVNGKALYASNSCGSCHGTPPAFSKVLNGANNPTVIQNAIANIGGMNKYVNLTTQNLADIAAYLATPNI
jgi:mono/diheme cytochrome c family protein